MRNLIAKKLRSKKGETLVESLAAILIFTMASIVMFSMVTTAGNINSTAKEMDRSVQEQLVGIEKGDPGIVEGGAQINITMTTSRGTTNMASGEVVVYGGQNGSLYAYYSNVDPDTVTEPTESEAD